MADGPGKSVLFLQYWIVAWMTVGTACDSNFDTNWQRDGDAGSLNPDASAEPDASGPDASAVDAGPFDAGDIDTGLIPVLPRVNCAGLVGHAGPEAGCEFDCAASCTVVCRDAGTCGDAEVWLTCAECLDGGIPPPP
jgi:hypothetical protein